MKIECPHCEVGLDLENVQPGERLECPNCGEAFRVDQQTAKERKTETLGVGCLVQGVGVLMLLSAAGALAAGMVAGDLFLIPAVIGGVMWLLAGLCVLLIGLRLAVRWFCCGCGNPVHPHSRLCPVCKEPLAK